MLRTIAAFEALNGIAALADVIRVLDLMHHDFRRGLFRTDDGDGSFATLLTMNPSAAFLYTRGAEGAGLYVGDKT